MAPTPNKSFIYKKIPEVYLLPGEHLTVEDRPLDLDTAPLEGGILVKVFYSSFDPYIRDLTRDPAIEDFAPALIPDTPILSAIVGRVLRSSTPLYTPGDLVAAFDGPNAEYAVIPGRDLARAGVRKVVNPWGLDISYFLGVLGMPGGTAFQGLYNIGKPKRGETILVSAAAGPVGQLVGQLAKAEGLRVIGSAGSQAKIDFVVNELGFDAAFNYKTEEPDAALKRLAPDGIDIYWDGVGGPLLDAALLALRQGGRIVSCGMMAMYHTKPEDLYGVRNLIVVPNKGLTMAGFIFDYDLDKYQAMVDKVAPLLASGDFKALQDVTVGIDNAPEGLAGIFTGKNFGKGILKIAEPDL
ncbi:related to reductase RED1 [Cephalotrichum gorgonifer]|uniref:Dehydrogenase FUB6 n=1 Tax=Cephalotrichum gorgonifer TaxID=2041049 RepID=A0AAE8N8A0_9PEZI|nr:related to reductase RED1 [Cephalotrichum gorgonifer]